MNLAIIICTYNRLEYVKKNINILDKQCRSFVKHVYVVDNASNLPKSLSNDFITVIHNKNLGGSGGFARGMYEAKKEKKFSHIMLMDDDIEFNSDTLKQAIDKVATIEKNAWFALGMKTFESRDILQENTAYWSGIKRKSNYKGYNDANKYKYKNNVKYNYASWWSLIMPISVISEYGYPMPYFIKSDDIEYGMRRKNEKIYFDNNIFVLHEDFDKKYNHTMVYYSMRNHLITNILHFKHSLFKSSFMFVLRMCKAWLTGNYPKLKLSSLGLYDYLKGPSFFVRNDFALVNKKILETANNTKFNIFKFIFYPFIVLCDLLKLIFKHRKLKQEYLSEFKYLTSEKYWEKHFFN